LENVTFQANANCWSKNIFLHKNNVQTFASIDREHNETKSPLHSNVNWYFFI